VVANPVFIPLWIINRKGPLVLLCHPFRPFPDIGVLVFLYVKHNIQDEIGARFPVNEVIF
jgi:hypothetical protein